MILHIPHSGVDTLDRDIEPFDIYELTDWFTDELFQHKNSDRLVFPISRFVCDVERFYDDKEPMLKIGQGICYTKGTNNNNIEVKDKEFIIKNYYEPHHKKLNDAVRKLLPYKPIIIIVDCHSFNPKNDNDPDFCIGTNTNTPEDVILDIKEEIADLGYSVKINNPFTGALQPSNFENDCRTFSIMIEVNKKLYMNGLEKSENFNKVKEDITKILNIISDYEESYDV